MSYKYESRGWEFITICDEEVDKYFANEQAGTSPTDEEGRGAAEGESRQLPEAVKQMTLL